MFSSWVNPQATSVSFSSWRQPDGTSLSVSAGNTLHAIPEPDRKIWILVPCSAAVLDNVHPQLSEATARLTRHSNLRRTRLGSTVETEVVFAHLTSGLTPLGILDALMLPTHKERCEFCRKNNALICYVKSYFLLCIDNVVTKGLLSSVLVKDTRTQSRQEGGVLLTRLAAGPNS